MMLRAQPTANALSTMRKESILSIASAAKRMGHVTVVVGQGNHRVRCEHAAINDEFKWWWDDWPTPSHKISFLLDDAQGSRP